MMMRRNIIHRSKNILHNATQNSRIRCHQHLKNLGALSSTCYTSDYNTSSLLVAHSKRSIYIEPMPAVAYDDYEYDDTNINDDDLKNSSKQNFMTSTSNTIYNVYAGGPSNNNNTNNNGPLGVENDKLSNNLRFIGRSTKGNGGGGGSGGHRCPKCGAHVTFQSSSTSNSSTNKNALQSNCFYCASCSGWFLIQPNLVDGTYRNESSSAHSKYLLSKLGKDGLRKNVSEGEGEEGGSSGDDNDILPTTPSKRKIGHKNQFVMRHVSLFVYLFVRVCFVYCAHTVQHDMKHMLGLLLQLMCI